MKRLLFDVYQWLIVIPLLVPVTALTAIVTIILSPIVPNSELAYWPARMWARIICKLLFIKVEVRGLEHIQKGQSYVFVCNHQSLFDVFVIYGWLPVIWWEKLVIPLDTYLLIVLIRKLHNGVSLRQSRNCVMVFRSFCFQKAHGLILVQSGILSGEHLFWQQICHCP